MTENMNWHFKLDGARRGLRIVAPTGGVRRPRERDALTYRWDYTKRRWELRWD